MNDYQWYFDPDLAPLGSIIGVCIGLGFTYLYLRIKGEL